MSEHKESPLGAAVRQVREGPSPVAMIQAFNEGKHGDAPRSPMFSPEGEPIPPNRFPYPLTQGQVWCGNFEHPRHTWHPAASLPASWDLAERFIQWYRRRKYGCGCQP